MSEKLKIIVAMSGGVDSSVAAALLAKEGHEVIGVTMRLLPNAGEGFGCCGAPEDIFLAKRSAEKAGIPHYVLDYSPEFETKVIDYFVDSYLSGETPNPCLACNKHIKFDKLKKFAESLGASHVATGHYARIESSPLPNGSKQYRLFESIDSTKDQSYVLYNFDQKGLSSTFFPIGGAEKTKVREMAKEFGMPNADKKDSQEICFVPKKDYRSFIKIRLDEKGTPPPSTTQPGQIKDEKGNVIGEHRGIAFYTIGQRSGLGLNTLEKTYVSRLDPKTNTMTVGSDMKNFATGLIATDLNWVSGNVPANSFEALVKIRYKHEPASAAVEVNGNQVRVKFKEPQRAVTPGQAAVFYQFDSQKNAREVLGGGKITEGIPYE